MGKYLKKSKIAGDVSVSDFSNPITFSFRTRAAKNLALQRLRSDSTSPSDDADSFRYLQLRSRRLVKLPLLADTKKQQQQKQKKQLIHGVAKSRTRNPKAEKFESAMVTETVEDCGSNEGKYGSDCNFGEKGFDFESRDRRKRETKSCNLTRDSEVTQSVPSSSEIEDFFAYAEQQQQRNFIEKYNFDTVSDNPLPGRYEWFKVEP